MSHDAGERLEDAGVIGRGGTGWVHRVFDTSIRRYAALKLLDERFASEPEARDAFLAEARITGQLEHPNIVPVYDLFLADGGVPRYFTMKIVEGDTLATLVDPHRLAERTEAELWDLLGVFLKVCDAVGYANSRGVVHRDLKPTNVMVGAHGQVYVVDWGIARVLEGAAVEGSTVDPPGGVFGTYEYMAPEQAWGRTSEIDARTDVFALGGLLYFLLTGRPPYSGATAPQSAREGRVRSPDEVAPGTVLRPDLCRIAMKALSAAREDRHASAGELRGEVERAMRRGLTLQRVVFPAGAVIVHEGGPPSAAYFLVSGRCEAFQGEGDARRVLRVMGPGEVFGEMALISSRPRSASVVALEQATVLLVTPEALRREIHPDSWVVALLGTLVERFRELEERLPAAARP